MKKLTAADTLALSIPERIQLVEDIWDTIQLEIDEVELTEAEKQIIDKRLVAYYQNRNLGSPWNEVLNRIAGKHEL